MTRGGVKTEVETMVTLPLLKGSSCQGTMPRRLALNCDQHIYTEDEILIEEIALTRGTQDMRRVRQQVLKTRQHLLG